MRFSLAFSSLVLVACGSDTRELGEPARFEAASEEQLMRTMTAAMGFDSLFVSFVAAGYASAPDSTTGCPKIATEGSRRRVTGGCTSSEGERIDGQMILENVPGLFGEPIDPALTSSLEAIDFAMMSDEGPVRVDGTMSWQVGGESLASLDVEIGEINVFSGLRFSCPDNACAHVDSVVDVEDLGSATVTGTFAYSGENPQIAIEVTGADTLSIRNEGQCLSYLVGSRSRTICSEEQRESARLTLRPGLFARQLQLAPR